MYMYYNTYTVSLSNILIEITNGVVWVSASQLLRIFS